MTDDKLSILMAVYNAEDYLSEAIESILHQSFVHFKFVIIDDCSTDKSCEIIEHYRKLDSRIFVHRNSKNQGLAKSLNIGLKFCTSDYVARMDADDVSEGNRLERQYEFLQKNADIDVCGTWITLVDKHNNNLGNWKTPLNHRNIVNKNFIAPALAHPTVMWRTSKFINRLLYNETYTHSEDYELWVRISSVVKFSNIGEFLLKYRISTSGMTFDKKRSVEKKRSLLRIQNYISNLINLNLNQIERKYYYAINSNDRLKDIRAGDFKFILFLIKFYFKVTMHTKLFSLNFIAVLFSKYIHTFYRK
jgi:glycosyltransferase involved in cell wall biosynthesis